MSDETVKKKWVVTTPLPAALVDASVINTAKTTVEALCCEVQNGALLFWDGGLKRAFGAGAWTECELKDGTDERRPPG